MTRPLHVGVAVVLLALLQTSLLPGVATQGVDPKEDLCKHSFHSFLCNPAKNSKRRVYDGSKALTGADSNRQATAIAPPDEPNLEGDNSNDDPAFQGPGYLPPKGSKNLFNDGSDNDDVFIKLPTTTTRRPTTTTTTRRPTTTTTTTRRPTTTTTTTRRPTTTTTRRPTTTTTTQRSREYLPPPGKDVNLVGGDSFLDPSRLLLPTTTTPRPAAPAKSRPDDLCAHSFHSFLCDSGKPKKQRRVYNGQRTAPGDTNFLGENSFPQPSRLLPPTSKTPPPSRKLIPENANQLPVYLPPTPKPTPRTAPTPAPTPRPTPRTAPTPKPTPKPTPPPQTDPEVAPDAAQNPSVRVKPDGDADLCKHSFHAFLCDSGKGKKQRRVYDGQRASPAERNLVGGSSFNRETSLRLPTTTTARAEPNLEGDNSNDDPAFQGPGYLPPKGEKDLFGGGSDNDDSFIKLTTTATRRRTTTRRPTRTTTTTRRPTTTTTTTKRPTTTTTTTRRPRTTTTTQRSREYLPPPGKDVNLVGGDSFLDPSRLLLPTTTTPRPAAPAKSRPEDLCAHSFHSFLCDSGKPKKQRRVYNGQRTAPGDTNFLGENSFPQPSRLLPPTSKTPPPNRKLIPENANQLPVYLPPTPKPTPRTAPTPAPTPRPTPRTAPTPTPTPKPTPPPQTDPEVAPDAAQNPSVRVKPDGDADLCKHSFHAFLCDSGKGKKQRRVYDGQRASPAERNLVGGSSFNRETSLRVPTTTARPEPNLEGDNSNDDPAFQGPGYLPPKGEKNLFGGGSDNDDSFIKLTTTTTRRRTTTRRPTRTTTTTRRPTTTTTTTRRPTTTTTTTRRPRTTTTTQRSREYLPPPGKDVNLVGGDSFLDPSRLLLPTTTTPRPAAPAKSSPDDLCAHSFHSFLCDSGKPKKQRRVYDGQHSNIVGANSFREAQRVRAPSREVFDTAASTYRAERRRFEAASSNVEETHVAAPTSKPIPASLARLNPPTTTTTTAPREEVEPAAAEAPSVRTAPEHHHDDHHHDDHHHDEHHHGDHAHSAATDHAHAHGDHHGDHAHGHGHGDHHHHHHNITLEQLCRDPFHAFLCLNVDSSKRRVYDGNPVEDSLSWREHLQLTAASSVRESRKVAAPSAVKTVDVADKPAPLSYLQQRAQFPSTAQPLTFDVTTYVREPATTRQPEATTPTPEVVQTKYINPDLVRHEQPQRQRRPALRAPTPTQGTFPGERVRRPSRRRPRPDANAEQRDVSFRPESVPEFVARRADEVAQTQEAPRRARFGDKAPRRKRLPTPEGQPSPGEFVRGPRGAVRALDVQERCKEPFQGFQCGNRERRAAGNDGERRTGNMRGQAQGHEVEEGADEVRETVTEKTKRVKVNKRVEQRVKVDEDKGVETTTEDQYVVYQRGIEEEKKRREEEEEKREEELKRREVELKNRKEELKRREKEQERRKVEDRKRKEDLMKRKIEEAERKEALKKLENEERLEDEKEDRDDKDEDEEDDKEDAEKDELLSDYEKSIKAEEKRRAEEAKRRADELVRREQELERRKKEDKRRQEEAERRKVHDKLVEEELERRKIEKVRVAEELVRREAEDERRKLAKKKLEESE